MDVPEEKEFDDLANAIRASSRSPAESVALILRKRKNKKAPREGFQQTEESLGPNTDGR